MLVIYIETWSLTTTAGYFYRLLRVKPADIIMLTPGVLHQEFNDKQLNIRLLLIYSSTADREDSGVFVKTSADTQETTERLLTEDELAIHNLHIKACEDKRRMYVDPASGYKVFTEFAHRQRGSCCGSACRHRLYVR
ncbi:hypothetical protein DPEC_G00337830 [Dallia pectoralis]|uniref:Uncharacterized protein n=1 Tax=Dallia pectoralis TaxID=75939 RepID=A0ACC2F4D2_DALPE|nr:hypothetical protein DPEC_G00337830 [Dallia pectoralis]